jgi:hypothetical protein
MPAITIFYCKRVAVGGVAGPCYRTGHLMDAHALFRFRIVTSHFCDAYPCLGAAVLLNLKL